MLPASQSGGGEHNPIGIVKSTLQPEAGVKPLLPDAHVIDRLATGNQQLMHFVPLQAHVVSPWRE
jgi:hypothetical protein